MEDFSKSFAPRKLMWWRTIKLGASRQGGQTLWLLVGPKLRERPEAWLRVRLPTFKSRRTLRLRCQWKCCLSPS
eukprot:6375486-Amphidinium_carterae.1